jgi:hypothetical protein
MKRNLFSTVLLVTILWLAHPLSAIGQVASGDFKPPGPFWVHPAGMEDRGYGMGQPREWIQIPSKLPAPHNDEWVKRLKQAWVSENGVLGQFEADQEKFNAFMPYMMVIPQTDRHVRWVEALFKAYGLTPDEQPSLVGPAKTLTEAFEKSAVLENELATQYEWLVKNAEDRDSARILDTILIRTRIHHVMFEHALRMGQGYGVRMRNIMGLDYGYGFGTAPGIMLFGTERPAAGKSITARDATSMVRKYLKSSQNPNLQVGKVRDAKGAFEVEIVTLADSLVDKILVDKSTGRMRSAYYEHSGVSEKSRKAGKEKKEAQESYKQWTEDKLNGFGKKITDLEQKGAEAKGEAVVAYKDAMKDLRGKEADAKQKWAELKKAGAQNWDKAQSEMNGAIKVLEDSYEKTVSWLKAHAPAP